MLNTNNIKQYIIFPILFLLFNTVAFATDIEKIASLLNKGLDHAEYIARYEYEKNKQSESINNDLQSHVEAKLNVITSSLQEAEGLQIDNIREFTHTFIEIVKVLKSKMLLNWQEYGYTETYEQTGLITFASVRKVASDLQSAILEIYEFLSEDKSFAEDHYALFFANINTKNLLESDKKSLFNSLIKIKLMPIQR